MLIFFFLISGYVITQRLYKNYLEKKRISIINFYIRRFFRIFPNLFFIISFVYIFYLFFGAPDLSILKSTIFSILGLSNLFFLFREKNYFQTDLGNLLEDPLSHTWSLGIEEQFYLVYPFILFFVLWFSRKKNIFQVVPFLVIILFISLITSLFLQYGLDVKNKELIIFYFPFFRFWEFLIGCVFFFISNKIIKNNFISILCILLICYVLFFSNNIPYQLNNIIIVFASGIFILYYKDEFIFNNKILLYLGKISYSLYLWHLPIIYFSSVYFGNIISIIYTIILTPILSIITYKYVEEKFRKIILKKIIIYQILALSFLIILSLFYLKFYNENLRQDVRNFFKETNYLEKKFNWTERTVFSKNLTVGSKEVYSFCHEDSKIFTINEIGLRNECLKQINNETLFYVEGDSQTAQFLPILNDINIIENLYYKWSRNIKSYKNPDYNISYDEVNHLSKIFDKIIYVTDINSNERFTDVQKKFEKFNDNILILLFNSNIETGNIMPLSCLIRQYDCFINKNEDTNRRNLTKLNIKMKKFQNFNKNVEIYNSYDKLCPKKVCVVYDKEKDILMYRDNTHLTKEGARLIKDDLLLFLNEKYF